MLPEVVAAITRIIGIGEEADASHDDGADMVPAEGDLVELEQGQPASLIGVEDMGILVVDVDEGRVPTGCLPFRHCSEGAC